MAGGRIAPYGEWESPFPISLLTAGVVGLSFDGQVFGFEPADAIEPITVQLLGEQSPRVA